MFAKPHILIIYLFLSVFLVSISGSQSLAQSQASSSDDSETFDEEAVLDAATDFFGESAEDVAQAIQKVFKDMGEPNAYIEGSEGSGALIVGFRWGDGQLIHKENGNSRVHWTGPSAGFDAGANLSRVFVLVYNLYENDDIYRRFPAIEGSFYLVGGIGINYHQRGDIVIVPIRIGIGLRAGGNIGYLRYSKKKRWLPF